MAPTPNQATTDSLAKAIGDLLDRSALDEDERLHALASVFAVDALRPYCLPGRTAAEAREALRTAAPVLADALAALAPLLIGRLEDRAEAQDAVDAVEAMLDSPSR